MLCGVFPKPLFERGLLFFYLAGSRLQVDKRIFDMWSWHPGFSRSHNKTTSSFFSLTIIGGQRSRRFSSRNKRGSQAMIYTIKWFWQPNDNTRRERFTLEMWKESKRLYIDHYCLASTFTIRKKRQLLKPIYAQTNRPPLIHMMFFLL